MIRITPVTTSAPDPARTHKPWVALLCTPGELVRTTLSPWVVSSANGFGVLRLGPTTRHCAAPLARWLHGEVQRNSQGASGLGRRSRLTATGESTTTSTIPSLGAAGFSPVASALAPSA